MQKTTNLPIFGLGLGFFLGWLLLAASCVPAIPTDAPLQEALEDGGLPTETTGEMALADQHRWELVAKESDPWAAERPSTILCPAEEGYKNEEFNGEPSLQIHTGFCNYITAQQPTLLSIQKGQKVYFRLWHFAIYSPEGTQAHLALRLGSFEILEQRIPLPAKSHLVTTEWVAPTSIPQGTPFYFHLHNHGSNTWQLLEISLRGG